MPNQTRSPGEVLFPILPQGLTGLPKMAAEAERVDERNLVEFRSLKVRSVLNRSISKRKLWLAYSINPYRGCEFGCRYCYARYTHEFLAPKPSAAQPGSAGPAMLDEPEAGSSGDGTDFRDPQAFERVIFLKQNAAWLLE